MNEICRCPAISQARHNSHGIESWLRLINSDGLGPRLFARLIERFKTPDRALEASIGELAKVDGIGSKTAERIAGTRNRFDTQKELALAEKLGVQIINLLDERYPPALKNIYDPPPVIYIKGTFERSDNLAVAIVGSRRCSTYGSEQAARFAHLLASAGFTIISGLARGIDTAAHRGALSAKGRTIAVQGRGLAGVFPPENEKLFDLIAQSGACISELPLTYEPLSENFPPRNRIIAGLSLGVIVIEASERSGALITAKAALEYNREVMAVPGKIDSPVSQGSHSLIKQGARLIDSIDDIMDALGVVGQQLKEHTAQSAEAAAAAIEAPLFDAARLNLSADERAVYETLNHEPVHTEELIASTSLAAGAVTSALVSLRLKGLIKNLPGNMFVKR